MSYVSIGDLSLTFQNRRYNVEMKSDLLRLSQELASGQRQDISTSVSGDYLPIVGLERSLKNASAYATTTAEAALFASTMQASLELVQNSSSQLGPALLTAGNSEHPTMIQATTADARFKFEAVISAFNTRVADRYTFSGVATDTPALADASTILSSLQTTIAAETTAANIDAVVEAWFDDPGGGFETIAYIGSNTTLAPIHISQDEIAEFKITASDTDVREILKGFAIAALVGEGALSGDTVERAALTQIAGERLMTTESNLSLLRANVGSTEARIDIVSMSNASETSALEIVRSEVTAADPYRTATELEAVRAQLETFYTVTARLSNLSLSEYLR